MPRYLGAKLLLILLFAGVMHAQSPFVADVFNRPAISLNGTWHIIIDPYETGLNERYYENRKPQDKTDRVEYNFATSETLNVPGDWNTQKEKLFFYEGPLWYEKDFTYHPRPHTRVFLHFGAANYFTRVYLN